MEVHTFIRIAMHDNHPAMMNALFAGRMTLGDVVELTPLFESGFLVPAFYVPPWAKDLRTLAAAAAYSAFVSRIDLTQVKMQNFVAYEE